MQFTTTAILTTAFAALASAVEVGLYTGPLGTGTVVTVDAVVDAWTTVPSSVDNLIQSVLAPPNYVVDVFDIATTEGSSTCVVYMTSIEGTANPNHAGAVTLSTPDVASCIRVRAVGSPCIACGNH